MSHLIAKIKNVSGGSLTLSTFKTLTNNEVVTVFYDTTFFNSNIHNDIHHYIRSGAIECSDIYGNATSVSMALKEFDDTLDFVNSFPSFYIPGIVFGYNGSIAKYIIAYINKYIVDNNGTRTNFANVAPAIDAILLGLKGVAIDYWSNGISDTFYSSDMKAHVVDLLTKGFK